MKTELTETETDHLLPFIKSVLETGKLWTDETLHHPAGAIIDAVLSIEGVEKDESNPDTNEGFSTNGWDWDWVQDFTYRGKTYVLCGSGYYGGHTFARED